MQAARHRTWVRASLAAAAVAALGGCETASQDFNEWSQSLMPVSAGQAARLMVDPYDADNRYKGTVLIAGAPFGGENTYVAMYRDRAQHETDPLVRAASIRALGKYGTPADAMIIATNLDYPSDIVRWESALALQRLHSPAVVSDLLKSLRDEGEDPDVRCAVAIGLGQYAEDRVFQGLVGALDAIELGVNLSAESSLATLTGQDLGPDPRAWLTWYNATREPFAAKKPYTYPTYQRPESFLEKLAFWSRKPYEQPGTPTGLAPPGERSTYPDGEEPADDDEGG